MQKRIIFHPRSKKMRYVLLVVGVVVIAGGYLAWQQAHRPSVHNSTTDVAQWPATDAVIDAQVRTLIAQNNIDGMLSYYDHQAALMTTDPARLQMLRMNQSLRAMDAKRYDAALEAAKQADVALSNATTLGQIAQVYEAKGDKTDAITYYTKARDAVPVVKAGRFNRTKQYDDAIARLSK